MNRKPWAQASRQAGFSVFEIIIVISVFVLLIAVANQSFFASIRGQNKSEVQTLVKQDVNYAVSVIERALHSAQSVTSCSATSINYFDAGGKQQNFTCQNGSIYSTGVSIISSSTSVSSCNISCLQEGGLKTVTLDLTLSQSGIFTRVDEKSTAQIKTKIRLRN